MSRIVFAIVMIGGALIPIAWALNTAMSARSKFCWVDNLHGLRLVPTY